MSGLPMTGSTGSPGALSTTPGTTPRARRRRTATTPSATSSTSPTWARRTMSTAAAMPPGRAMPGRTRWSRAGGNTYAYDDNGNMVSGTGRTLTWTSFNKPATVVDAATRTAFVHGPDRARIRQTRVQGATTTTIKYVAGLFERVSKTGEATKSVHYIFAGGARIAIRTTDDAPSPTDSLRYLHQDHLGSVDTITDAAGRAVERLSYCAFGKRRVAAGENAWTDPALAIAAVNTPRGFTGHEHLDDFQLVHMNGRVYDPALGRFMSADPFVQFAESHPGPQPLRLCRQQPALLHRPQRVFRL